MAWALSAGTSSVWPVPWAFNPVMIRNIISGAMYLLLFRTSRSSGLMNVPFSSFYIYYFEKLATRAGLPQLIFNIDLKVSHLQSKTIFTSANWIFTLLPPSSIDTTFFQENYETPTTFIISIFQGESCAAIQIQSKLPCQKSHWTPENCLYWSIKSILGSANCHSFS